MGGYNSGGWNYSGRPTTESTFSVSLKRLRPLLLLGRFAKATLRQGCYHGTIEVGTSDVRVTVRRGEHGHSFWGDIGFQQVNCRSAFGWRRSALVCPVCQRRCLTVYLYGGRFACRICHRLPYGSQRERRLDRLTRKVDRQQRRLGSLETYKDSGSTPPVRPKGMHCSTYQRLLWDRARAAASLEDAEVECMVRLGQRLSR